MSAKPILCPRCESADVRLVEYLRHYIAYAPDDIEGVQKPGEVEQVVLVCRRCDHSHRLRNTAQMTSELRERLAANLTR